MSEAENQGNWTTILGHVGGNCEVVNIKGYVDNIILQVVILNNIDLFLSLLELLLQVLISSFHDPLVLFFKLFLSLEFRLIVANFDITDLSLQRVIITGEIAIESHHHTHLNALLHFFSLHLFQFKLFYFLHAC